MYSRQERLVLITLALVQFANIVDFMIMMPLGPQLMKAFSISPREFGFLVSIYNLAAAITGFSGVFFLDKLDRKVALRFFFGGFIIGTLACGLAPSYGLLLSARLFTGFFGGMLSGLSLSIVGDLIPAERRATAMGTLMASFSLASVIGVPAGLFIANLYGWQAPFLVLVGLALLIFVLVQLFIPNLREHLQRAQSVSPLAPLIAITQNKSQLAGLALLALLMGQFFVIPFISPYMVANVGFTNDDLPFIYLLGGGATIFSAPLVGRLADKIGKAKVFTIFAILSLIPLFVITNLPAVPLWQALLITTIFFITVNGRAIPSIALLTTTASPQQRAGLMSVNSCLQHLSVGLSTFGAGLLVTESAGGRLDNYAHAGYVSIALTLICLILVRYIVPLPSPAPVPRPLEIETEIDRIGSEKTA